MAYDPTRRETVLVALDLAAGTGEAAVWGFDGTGWALRPSLNRPVLGGTWAVAYDDVRGLLVLTSSAGLSVETWEWDGATWVRRTPSRAPARVGLIAFDSGRSRIVVFDRFGDKTWEWDGTDWTERIVAIHPTLASDMAYDAARGRVVLRTTAPATWEWDGALWTQRTPAHSTPAGGGGAMTYDSARQRLVLFGGNSANGPLRDTWEWDGADWLERTPTSAPSARSGSGAAYDSARQRVVLFGGQDTMGGYLDTWEWDGSEWTYRGPETTPRPRSGHAMVYDEGRQVTVLFGGSRPVLTGVGGEMSDDTWELDGTDWSFRSPVVQPPRRVGHAMTFDPVRSVAVLFGGYWQGPLRGGVLGDTWDWNGTRWTERTPATGPVPRGGHAFAWDRNRDRGVLFGGQDELGDGLADTWEWDGAGWQQRPTATAPEARSWHALCHDAARGGTLLFGGQTATGLAADTWSWDGGTWTRLVTPVAPPPRKLHALTWDAARQRVVLSGGFTSGGVLGDTWEWDGRAWVAQPPPSSHGPRYAHALGYDARLGRGVAFGGNDGTVRLGDTWVYEPTVRGGATQLGTGCGGAAGVPTIAAAGPPIVGNRDFAVAVGSAPPLATVLVGLSCALASQPLPGGCTLYVRAVILGQTQSSSSGIGAVSMPIPRDLSLIGVSVFAQGFVLDPQGAFLGLASFSQGLALRIGD